MTDKEIEDLTKRLNQHWGDKDMNWNQECTRAQKALHACGIPNKNSREIIEALGNDGQNATELTQLALDIWLKSHPQGVQDWRIPYAILLASQNIGHNR